MAALVFKLTSQPSKNLSLLQSPQPASQVPAWHDEDAHTRVMWFGEQYVPHPPQLFGSLETSRSQPFAVLLSQSAQPVVQLPPQTPPLQFVKCNCAQSFPQAPQFVGDVRMFVSHPSSCLLLLQSPYPEAQVPAQEPATHAGNMF